MTPSRITIVVDSRYGTTLTLAKAIAEGAANEQAEVRLRRVALSEPEFSVDTERADFIAAQAEYRDLPQASMADLEWATGIIWGSPTRYGLMSTPLRAFIDEVAPLWRQGALIGKVGAAFTSTASQHGGQETTQFSILTNLIHMGMTIVGLDYGFDGQLDLSAVHGNSPYGASTIAGGDGSRQPSDKDLAGARYLGKRVAKTTAKLHG